MSDENEVRCVRCGKPESSHSGSLRKCWYYDSSDNPICLRETDRFTPAATPQYRELGADEVIEAGDELENRPRTGAWVLAERSIGDKVSDWPMFQFRRRVTQGVVGAGEVRCETCGNILQRKSGYKWVIEACAQCADRQARARKVAEEVVSKAMDEILDRCNDFIKQDEDGWHCSQCHAQLDEGGTHEHKCMVNLVLDLPEALTTALLQFDFGQVPEMQPGAIPGRSTMGRSSDGNATATELISPAGSIPASGSSPATVQKFEPYAAVFEAIEQLNWDVPIDHLREVLMRGICTYCGAHAHQRADCESLL